LRFSDLGRNKGEAMSVEKKPHVSGHDPSHQRRFYRIGAVILSAGLLVAALVYATTAPDDPNDPASILVMPRETKSYEYQMEVIGGKSNVLAAEFREWFDGLWHGRRLALTLAVLSIGASLGCFFVAHLTTEPPPDIPADRNGG
jgi:hypothetical protein